MSTLTSAAAAVRSAESSLRELMQSAVASGDYRDLPALARVAEQLSETASRLEQPGSGLSVTEESRRSVVSPRRRDPTKKAPKTASVRRRTTPTKREYPKFRRDRTKLLKVGWSKSERSEYRHRVPKHIACHVLTTINKFHGAASPFTVEQILPLKDPSDGTEVAPHQVYISLAWLKSEGIVMQHGRDGYSVLVNADPEKLFEERWTALLGK
jgi:hypothetical protein